MRESSMQSQQAMTNQLFESALGITAPWHVQSVVRRMRNHPVALSCLSASALSRETQGPFWLSDRDMRVWRYDEKRSAF